VHLFILLPFLFFFTSTLNAQPGFPYNPETADGAVNIGGYNTSVFQLKWVNPTGIDYNELYCSYDSAKVSNLDTTVRANGYPSTVFSDYSISYYHCMRYYWRIVEYNSSGRTVGPVWRFFTKANYDGDNYFINDDFINGAILWNISGDQFCKWKPDIASAYTLPAPASGNVLSVKNLQNGVLDSSVAFFQKIILPSYVTFYSYASIEFESDLKLDNPSDGAYIDYSSDQGLNWITAWSKTGASDRNNHIDQTLFETELNSKPDSILIRLRVYLVDNTSWWAIDNFTIKFYSGYLTIPYVSDLHLSITSKSKVQINFGSYVGSHNLYRKDGLPLSSNRYTFIATINDGSKSFIDTTANDSSVYTYKVTNNWGTSLSFYNTNEATAYLDKILPVELSSFTCMTIDKGVKLLWTTTTEINNNGFYVERSFDRKIWNQIGFVKGTGNSNVSHNYIFSDNIISGSKILYRLKQVDANGAFKYSQVIETGEVLNGFQLGQNYPNPFNPSTSINYSLAKTGNVKLTVYNSIGSKVATLVNEYKPAGNYSVEFNGSNLASGIYLYRLEAGVYSAVKKFILMK
jgi:hypothetical protein